MVCPGGAFHGRRATWVLAGCRVLAVLVVLATPAGAREYRFGEITIRSLPDLPQSTTHGYHEFPFLVVNESASRTYQVSLAGPTSAQVGMGLSSLRRIERTVTVGPESAVRLRLLQPPLPVFGSGLSVRIDGRRQSETIAWTSGHPEYWVGGPGRHAFTRRGSDSRRVLIGQQLSEDDFPPHSEDEYRVVRAVMPLAAWSEEWLAYSGFDGIVVGAAELATAPAGVSAALWRYVETGGALTVLGPAGAADGFVGELRPRASVFEEGLEVYYAGFGVAFHSASRLRVAELDGRQLERLEGAWLRSREPWDRVRDPSGAHRALPVSEDVEVPVRGLFLVVVGFTLLVGPINLAVLTRTGRRTWLLWTVPVASLLACLAVVASVVLGEGLVRLSRIESLTILDHRTHRATTLGWCGFYSTLTPGKGLRFALGSELSPFVSWIAGTQDAARTVEWRAGQHFGQGWMKARVPTYFMIRKSEPRRERLGLRQLDDGRLEAVNGLGVDLTALWVAGDDGRLHKAPEPPPAGATVALEPTSEVVGPSADSLRQLYSGDLPSRILRLEQEPVGYLRPGSYLAVAAASPFVEEGLAGVDRTRLRAVIYGLLETDEP